MDKSNAEFSQEMLDDMLMDEPHISDKDLIAILGEDNFKLLQLIALQEILNESSKVIDEIKDQIKLSYTHLGIVKDGCGVEFESGLKLAYTKPKQKTLKDYDDDIKKSREKLRLAQEQKIDFELHGCEENKSKPILGFGTTNSKFKKSVAVKKAEILKDIPILNQIKKQIKEIEN